MTAAAEAILRYFRQPPRRTPDDLGIVFGSEGAEYFAPAADLLEITPALPVSPLPGSPHGVAFWRGKAYEVRGNAAGAVNFILVGGGPAPFFAVSETRPRAVSRTEAPGPADYREAHGRR
ncbi:MAG TPA: hypothetical protein VKH46_03645 [Thermoanaerobaculia bacterium]|nr:hypothetical protein [Thermoanaerobaculia bacterium]